MSKDNSVELVVNLPALLAPQGDLAPHHQFKTIKESGDASMP